MYAGANTQRAQKRIFTCVKGKKRSLSLSFFLFCLCRRCCCSNASRVVRFESEEEEEKNNDSEKFFFFTHAKRHKIYCTVLDFFSLSRSRSLRSSSSSSRATTPREREREREREVRISSKTLFVSRFAKHTCALSLFFRCSEYFLFFFFRESG